MKAYKGFDKDLKCRGFQYEIGKEYETGEAKLCETGFHACEAPMDVLRYYAPNEGRYCEVDLDGVSNERESGDTKICAKKIKIGAEIGIPGLVKAHIDWVNEHIDKRKKQTIVPGDASSASNTGDASIASNTGNASSASNTGYASSASNTGYASSASNTGDASSASNTGDASIASNTGNASSAEVSGKDSVAIVCGKDGKARGSLGCAIVATERGDWNGETFPLIAICSAIVDGETIKADTWYTVKNGEFVEVEDD